MESDFTHKSENTQPKKAASRKVRKDPTCLANIFCCCPVGNCSVVSTAADVLVSALPEHTQASKDKQGLACKHRYRRCVAILIMMCPLTCCVDRVAKLSQPCCASCSKHRAGKERHGHMHNYCHCSIPLSTAVLCVLTRSVLQGQVL